jgi:hypothetical protein
MRISYDFLAWLLYSEAPASFAGWTNKGGKPLNLFHAYDVKDKQSL